MIPQPQGWLRDRHFFARIQWYNQLSATEINVVLTEIIKEIKSGSSSAEEELSHILYYRLRPVVRRFFSHPDDILSNTSWIICKFIQKIDMFSDKRNPLPFLNTLSINHCIDEMRKIRSKERREFAYAYKRNDYIDQDHSVKFLLDDIVGKYSNIVGDVLLNKMSPVSVAEKHGVSKTFVQKQVRKAKKLIKEEVQV